MTENPKEPVLSDGLGIFRFSFHSVENLRFSIKERETNRESKELGIPICERTNPHCLAARSHFSCCPKSLSKLKGAFPSRRYRSRVLLNDSRLPSPGYIKVRRMVRYVCSWQLVSPSLSNEGQTRDRGLLASNLSPPYDSASPPRSLYSIFIFNSLGAQIRQGSRNGFLFVY